jgi:glycosyltransferase involved in cell wall biosynthesis
MKISLTCITGNCESDIARFLDSFQPHFDELVIVRAIGNQSPDRTLEIAKERGCIVGEYLNHEPGKDWPHVDNFAQARNYAASLATGDWLAWADLDDVCEGFENARAILEKLPADMWILKAPYIIPEQGTDANLRERFWRNNGKMQWINAIHENLASQGERPGPDGVTQALRVLHAPRHDRQPSNERNLRILETIPEADRTIAHHWYYFCELAREDRTKGQAIEAGKKFLAHPESSEAERYEAWMVFAQLCDDVAQTATFLASAWAESPGRAEALYELANLSMQCGNFDRAESYIAQAVACKWPEKPFWNHRRPFYGWLARDLERQIMRIKGQPKKADVLEFNDQRSIGRTVISLVHATRGRVEQSTRARANWLAMARHPERIEHIFGIDADDESSTVLARFNSVTVTSGGGCVRAWNMAAAKSTGDIIVQLSDDWMPPRNWDVELESRMDTSKAQVLAVSDGVRNDDLLCMAILTRRRLIEQGTLFHPDFLGVYSDNWFTHCAKRDGVIIEARDLVFEHQHPAFGKAEMDETYAKQNSEAAYAYGKRVFEKLMEGDKE